MFGYGFVSIITPTYNCGRFIADTIECVITQTYTNWELIIVDDCSTDSTKAIITPYLDKDSRIRYFCNEKNSGAAITRNKALREAKGRWIAFLDSDDLWHPEKLERQLAFMQKYGYGFSYTNYCEIDEDSKELGVQISGPEHITKCGMFNYCWPGCLTVMYDASKVGLVQIADIKKNNDYAMWLKICKNVDCYLLEECLAKYRKRKGSISHHSYLELIKWHYALFRQAENQNFLLASVNTLRNLCFGVVKKIFYVKSVR